VFASVRETWGFRGWQMVGVAFLVDFIAVGFFFYSFGVFLKEIAADLETSRMNVSMGISISNFVGALAAPFIGRSLDRRSIRGVMIVGALIVGAGFALLSRVEVVWHYYLVLGSFLAFGMSMMGGLASSKLVANWFDARRGTALGIATMGVSLSGLLMPAVATWLVATMGWRNGFLCYAAATVVVVIPLVARFVVNRPEELGLRPDGEPHDETSMGPGFIDEHVWRTRDILRSANFWAIAVPFSLVFSALSAVLTHLVAYADDLGIASYRAAWVLSLSAGVGVLGKLTFGWLVDRVDPRFAIWGSFLSQTLGLLLLMQDGYGFLLIGGVVFGFGMGGVIPLHGAVAGRAFGRLSFGKVMGLLRPVQVPVHAIGIPLAGWLYDRNGNYDLAFEIFVGVFVCASALIVLLKPGPSKQPQAHPSADTFG
jgi:MFS family permease